MGYIEVISYNPLTNHLLTSWDIQVTCSLVVMALSWDGGRYLSAKGFFPFHCRFWFCWWNEIADTGESIISQILEHVCTSRYFWCFVPSQETVHWVYDSICFEQMLIITCFVHVCFVSSRVDVMCIFTCCWEHLCRSGLQGVVSMQKQKMKMKVHTDQQLKGLISVTIQNSARRYGNFLSLFVAHCSY